MSVQRNIPRFCAGSICGWNLFQSLGLAKVVLHRRKTTVKPPWRTVNITVGMLCLNFFFFLNLLCPNFPPKRTPRTQVYLRKTVDVIFQLEPHKQSLDATYTYINTQVQQPFRVYLNATDQCMSTMHHAAHQNIIITLCNVKRVCAN